MNTLIKTVLLSALSAFSLSVWSITYDGKPDCTDMDNNIGCSHPYVVQVSGFHNTGDIIGQTFRPRARCTAELIRKDPDKLVFLTAAHCATVHAARIYELGDDYTLGVSFDAVVNRPDINSDDFSWNQFITGAYAIVDRDYDRLGSYDLALIVFPIDGLENVYTKNGDKVDLSIPLAKLIDQENYLKNNFDATNPIMVHAVGYGLAEYLQAPGAGQNNGPQTNYSAFGRRLISDDTPILGLNGPQRNWFGASQNPALDLNGACNGDSGGPWLTFIPEADNLIETVVGITRAGDGLCRAMGSIQRIDTPKAQTFINCALTADDLKDCGCTVVDNDGLFDDVAVCKE
jgi:hypothetical protein